MNIIQQRIQHYVTSSANSIQQFETGQRVAVFTSKKWYYGYIHKMEGREAYVCLDRGSRMVSLKVPLLVPTGSKLDKLLIRPVEMWADNPIGQELKDLPVTTLSVVELYSQKKSVAKLGFATFYGMYALVNNRIFNMKLPDDLEFRFMAKSKRYGAVLSSWQGQGYKIKYMEISKQQHVIQKLFTTIAHECIHVLQYVTAKTKYPYKENMHGTSFVSWIPYIKLHLNLDITITTAYDQDTELADSVDNNKGPIYYAMVASAKGGSFIGFKTVDRKTAYLGAKLYGYKVYQVQDPRIATYLFTKKAMTSQPTMEKVKARLDAIFNRAVVIPDNVLKIILKCPELTAEQLKE